MPVIKPKCISCVIVKLWPVGWWCPRLPLFSRAACSRIGRADFFLWFRDFKNSTNGAGYDFRKH